MHNHSLKMPVVTRRQARSALADACIYKPAGLINNVQHSVQPLGDLRLREWATKAVANIVWPSGANAELFYKNMLIGYKWIRRSCDGSYRTPIRDVPLQLNRGYSCHTAELESSGMHFFDNVLDCLAYISKPELGDCVVEVVVVGLYARDKTRNPVYGCQKCVAAHVWITDKVFDVFNQKMV